jgi:hypothetical protein
MGDSLAVPAEWVLGFRWGKLSDLALVDLLGLFYPQSWVVELEKTRR